MSVTAFSHSKDFGISSQSKRSSILPFAEPNAKMIPPSGKAKLSMVVIESPTDHMSISSWVSVDIP
jgi:hypothetical protein